MVGGAMVGEHCSILCMYSKRYENGGAQSSLKSLATKLFTRYISALTTLPVSF